MQYLQAMRVERLARCNIRCLVASHQTGRYEPSIGVDCAIDRLT